jgi:hypothetical protein
VFNVIATPEPPTASEVRIIVRDCRGPELVSDNDEPGAMRHELFFTVPFHPDDGHYGLWRLAFRQHVHETLGYPNDVYIFVFGELQHTPAMMLDE